MNIADCPRCGAPASEALVLAEFTGNPNTDPKTIYCTNAECGVCSEDYTDTAEGIRRWNDRDPDFIDESSVVGGLAQKHKDQHDHGVAVHE